LPGAPCYGTSRNEAALEIEVRGETPLHRAVEVELVLLVLEPVALVVLDEVQVTGCVWANSSSRSQGLASKAGANSRRAPRSSQVSNRGRASW
jgi:hypothetical protein